MTIETNVHIWREGNQYVAHAMPIDVMSCGATPEAARAAVDEAVQLFAATAADSGTLDDVLIECGYTRREDAWVSPEVVAVERRSLPLAV